MFVQVSIKLAERLSDLFDLVLTNELAQTTKPDSFVGSWGKFAKLRQVLDKDQSLANLEKEWSLGLLSAFQPDEMESLICALFQDSEKRRACIVTLHAPTSSRDADE